MTLNELRLWFKYEVGSIPNRLLIKVRQSYKDTRYKFNQSMSPKLTLNTDQFKRWGINLLKFSAPSLAVFFAQLAMGVNPKAAVLVALLTLYGLLADYFGKLKQQ